jgi:uncharacterized membrane protein YkoI
MTKLSSTVHAAFISMMFNAEVRIFNKHQNTLKRTIMKIKMIVCSALAASLLVGCISEKCEHHDKQAKQAKLMAEAKVSKDDAQKTAQAKVPNGTVKEGELEKEKGKLIWSFGFTIPDSKDIKEVNVNAVTGDVVGDVETETPADQAKDAAEDSDRAKKGGDKEDKD